MDYHHNTVGSMGARLFWSQSQSKFSKNRQLDSHPDCHCRPAVHIEPAGDDLNRFMAKVIYFTPGRNAHL